MCPKMLELFLYVKLKTHQMGLQMQRVGFHCLKSFKLIKLLVIDFLYVVLIPLPKYG